MIQFDKNSFTQFMIEHQIVGFWPEALLLKSGKKSHFYVDWRRASHDAFLLDQVTDYLVSFLKARDSTCECLFGVPEGASKTAIIAGFKMAKQASDFAVGSHQIPMGRGKPKSHGHPADRYFVGMPEGRVWVLEDTVTTGGSLLETVEQLCLNKVQVAGVVALTDRQDRTDQNIASKLDEQFGVKNYAPLSFAKEVLVQILAAEQTLSEELRHHIEKEMTDLY